MLNNVFFLQYGVSFFHVIMDVNLTVPAIKSHKTNSLTQKPNFSNEKQEPHTITHNEEKIAIVLFITGGFAIWNIFQ